MRWYVRLGHALVVTLMVLIPILASVTYMWGCVAGGLLQTEGRAYVVFGAMVIFFGCLFILFIITPEEWREF